MYLLQEEIVNLKQGSMIIENINVGLEGYDNKIEKIVSEFNNLITFKDESIKKYKSKIQTYENKILTMEESLEEKSKLIIIHSKNIEVNNKKFSEEKKKLLIK